MADDPIEFEDLDPYLRAVALVGQYLQRWSSLESSLNEAIGRAFGLTAVQEAIITRNMQLRDKLNVLKTVIALVNNDRDSRYTKTLTEIGNLLTTERNLLAHESFWDDDKGDGVQFLTVRAKGKLTFPNIRWSIQDFQERYNKLYELRNTVKLIAEAVKPFGAMRDANFKLPTPNAMFGGLGLLGLHPHYSQDNPGLGLLGAIPQTETETAPSTEE